MDSKEVKKILKKIPLRISITDHCNLNCFFCSNEGMDLNSKNASEADIENLLYILKLLKKNGLQKVSITGGDPTCYPQLERLLKEINKLKFERTFFHTNGVALSKQILSGELKKFSKIAISVHSLDFERWREMTGGKKEQFKQILENLKLVSNKDYRGKIEIKSVPIKGINDSKKSIKEILDLCEANEFKFKFLIFEPIRNYHRSLIVPAKEVSGILEDLGVNQLPREKDFRGQKDYLPINRYKYKSTEGVLIEIGCGKKEVCKTCSSSNEIFLTPNLEFKPCHINPHVINLKEAIAKKDDDKILNLLLKSRCFLKTSPGKNKQYWNQD
ncbi:radical SAM protein [Candidatus Pacearchaeota archaeon]|nr:radical SAM protein [Candidatus Pacearchaeota archaeon]